MKVSFIIKHIIYIFDILNFKKDFFIFHAKNKKITDKILINYIFDILLNINKKYINILTSIEKL